MNRITCVAFLTLLFAFAGCKKPQPDAGPVMFEITGLETRCYPGSTNMFEVKGTITTHHEALKGKIVELRLNGKAAFPSSGQVLLVLVDNALVTNGVGVLRGCYPLVSDDEKAVERVGRELSSPSSYSFETEGYVEVHPASVKVQ